MVFSSKRSLQPDYDHYVPSLTKGAEKGLFGGAVKVFMAELITCLHFQTLLMMIGPPKEGLHISDEHKSDDENYRLLGGDKCFQRKDVMCFF